MENRILYLLIIVGLGSISLKAQDATTPYYIHNQGETGYITQLSDVTLRYTLRLRPHATNGTTFYFGQGNNGVTQILQSANSTGAAAYAMSFNPFGGNVGIGTDSPSSTLQVGSDVNTSTESILRIGGSGLVNKRLQFYRAGTVDSEIFEDANEHLNMFNYFSGRGIIFGTEGVERVRINSNGNIGIGTTSPTDKLHLVDGSVELTMGNHGYDINLNTTSGWAREYSFSSNGSVRARMGARGTGDNLKYLYFDADEAVASTGHSNPEMVIMQNGNVGIGTTNPSQKLHVSGNEADYLALIENTGTGDGKSGLWVRTNSTWTSAIPLKITKGTTDEEVFQVGTKQIRIGTGSISQDDALLYVDGAITLGTLPLVDVSESSGSSALFVSSNGNVGMGTRNPGTNLHIYGNNAGEGNVLSSIMIGKNNGPEIQAIQAAVDDDIQELAFRVKSSSLNADNSFEALRIKYNGNVGIGTTTPGTYKLAVEGKIGARSVKVTTASWADYVFAPSYDLMSLQETEAYIQENQHLPNIPSAAEVEANGFNLEEMDAKLLAKIEELTLHMIDMNNQMQELRSENQLLKEKLDHLEKE